MNLKVEINLLKSYFEIVILIISVIGVVLFLVIVINYLLLVNLTHQLIQIFLF